MAKRRKPMQVTVETILEVLGLSETFAKAEPGDFYLNIKNTGWHRLVIEKVAADQVSVAHYAPSGDPFARDLRDPEIVFDLDTWYAVEVTMDPTNFYQVIPKGRYSPGIEDLARIWARNLRHQGFTDKDRLQVEFNSSPLEKVQ